MITVHKWTINPSNLTISINEGAKFRHIDVQYNQVCLWFEVDTSKPTIQKSYEIFGTGHEIPNQPDNYDFVGTVLLMQGQLVFHVYEYLK